MTHIDRGENAVRIDRRPWAVAAAVAGVLLRLVACSPKSPGPSSEMPDAGATEAGATDARATEGGATEAGTIEAGALATGPRGILDTGFSLISDSSGTTPQAGTSITLMCEAGGKAFVLAANDSAMLAHHGTWSYASGQLTMAFSASDFHPSATFALDPTASQVTMPFQVFSTDPGSSTWIAFSPDLASGGYAAANAEVSDPVVPCVMEDDAVAEMANYISGRTGVTPTAQPSALWPPAAPDFSGIPLCNPSSTTVASGDGGADDAGDAASETSSSDRDAQDGTAPMMRVGKRVLRVFGAAPSASPDARAPRARALAVVSDPCVQPAGEEEETSDGGTSEPPLTVVSVLVGPSSIVVGYAPDAVDPYGGAIELQPFEFLSGGVADPLSIGYYANDPRTALVPESPGNGIDDPESPTALIVGPFYSPDGDDRVFTFNEMPNSSGRMVVQTESFSGSVDGFDAPEDALQNNLTCPLMDASTAEACGGYTVTRLDDENASAVNITASLAGKAPGIIQYLTHGSGNGTLLTADVGCDARVVHKTVVDAMKDAGYSDLPDGAIDIRVLNNSQPAGAVPAHFAFAALAPAYWAWLQAMHGTDLSRSFVYLGACNTDSTPDLRRAIRSRAYVAYSGKLPIPFVGYAGLYMATLMARPTFSAEEAFYNVLRVMNTQELAYKEDIILADDDGGADDEQVSDLSSLIRGYGSENGAEPVPYFCNGWLSAAPSEDAGVCDPSQTLNDAQVWVLLWAARWGQNTTTGAQNLVDCYNMYWSDGDFGGIASPFCQNANSGVLPKADDVAYAVYLLGATGTSGAPGYSATLVPRFTMHDGQ